MMELVLLRFISRNWGNVTCCLTTSISFASSGLTNGWLHDYIPSTACAHQQPQDWGRYRHLKFIGIGGNQWQSKHPEEGSQWNDARAWQRASKGSGKALRFRCARRNHCWETTIPQFHLLPVTPCDTMRHHATPLARFGSQISQEFSTS